jgi:hypothetical protein
VSPLHYDAAGSFLAQATTLSYTYYGHTRMLTMAPSSHRLDPPLCLATIHLLTMPIDGTHLTMAV